MPRHSCTGACRVSPEYPAARCRPWPQSFRRQRRRWVTAHMRLPPHELSPQLDGACDGARATVCAGPRSRSLALVAPRAAGVSAPLEVVVVSTGVARPSRPELNCRRSPHSVIKTASTLTPALPHARGAATNRPPFPATSRLLAPEVAATHVDTVPLTTTKRTLRERIWGRGAAPPRNTWVERRLCMVLSPAAGGWVERCFEPMWSTALSVKALGCKGRRNSARLGVIMGLTNRMCILWDCSNVEST